MENKKRKTFATTIDSKISQEFKIACIKNNQAMNEVLEKLMVMYAEGKIDLSKK